MSARRGMTLLEVVVALVVAGAALSAGAAVLGFLTDQQSRPGAQAVLSAHAVRTTLREWTSSARLTTTLREWTSSARLTTEGDAEFRGEDGLTFVTSAPTVIARAGTVVHIYMKESGLVAELTPWRGVGTPVTIPLAPDAIGFEARYLGSIFGRRTWQPSWISTSVLPVAVELRVLFDTTVASPDRAAQALLALPMTIPLAGRR